MKKEYKILLIAGFICNFAENLFGPFHTVFVQKIGGDILTIGYLSTIYLIVSGFLIIIIGKLSDKWNKKWMTIAGYFILALGSLGYLFVSHPWHLFIIQINAAIGTALISSPLTALMSHYINKKEEGFQWSLGGGGNRIVLGLAVLIGTYLVRYFGFITLFITMFVLNLLAGLVQLQLVTAKKN